MADAPDVAAAKRRLAQVCKRLDAHRNGSAELLEERKALVVELRAAGVPRPELAQLAGCSVDLVKAMTRPPGSRKKAPARG